MEIETVAEIEVDVTNEASTEVDLLPTGPQGKDGLSAYDIYVKNGGILTETEWLASLKGETGQTGADGKDGLNGVDGKDGYTPVVGVDYWTETDKNDIKSYCDTYIEEQLGVIENGSY